MKKILCGFLGITLIIGLLASCGKGEPANDNESSTAVSVESISTEQSSVFEESESHEVQSDESSEEDSKAPVNKELEFNAKYIRTGYSEDIGGDSAVLIDASSELTSYYLENKAIYGLDSEFKKIINIYDMSYFADKVLVFVTCTEPSGSIRHEVKSAVYSEKDGVMELTLNVDRIIPEAGTDDMAGWHIIIELDRECAAAKDNIKIIMN